MLLALLEMGVMGFAAGWFGHMFHVWKKANWKGSRLQWVWQKFWR
jgi:hypothetical protein